MATDTTGLLAIPSHAITVSHGLSHRLAKESDAKLSEECFFCFSWVIFFVLCVCLV